MNNIWILSDKHFGHDMLWEKGYRPVGFADSIMENTLAAVRPGDSLIDLGDCYFSKTGQELAVHFLAKLREKIGPEGRLVLCRGNHDNRSIAAYVRDGWDWVSDGLKITYGGKDLWLTHEPTYGEFDLNVHGHLHAGTHREDVSKDTGHVLVSMELTQFRPVSLQRIIELKGDTPVWKNGRFVAKEKDNAC